MRKCEICGKGYMNAVRRSHSMRATKVRLYPNLQWLRMDHGQRVKACTKCMRTHSKQMAKVAA
jgi:ribosomal protein L28